MPRSLTVAALNVHYRSDFIILVPGIPLLRRRRRLAEKKFVVISGALR